MLQILQANTTQNLEFARALFKEYTASLGFDLDFQNFKEELANLPGDYAPPDRRLLIAFWQEQDRYNPIEGAAFMELAL